MEAKCSTCQLSQRKFYCTECLKTHLRDFRSSTQRAATERDNELAKVTKSLTSIQDGRLLRADQAHLEDGIKEIRQETRHARTRIVEAGKRVVALREALITRRANLDAAKSLASSSTALTRVNSQIKSVTGKNASTDTSLTSTRRILIQILVEAFDLRESVPEATSPTVTDDYSNLPFATASYIAGAGMAFFNRAAGGNVSVRSALPKRPPVKGEWSIAGLVLPVPGDLRRHPAENITAAVTHTLHFLRLLTFYLGVKLPFEISWSGDAPGVGSPSIAAGRGTDRGGWANWTTPYPLYLSEATPESGSSSSSTSAKPSLDSFTTGLCMLNYNIAYLSHTQGLDVPLSITGETLRNLWSVCCITTDGFGRASHSTPSRNHPLAPPTSSPTFSLDFAQVLQTASPGNASVAARPKHRRSSKSGGKSGGRGGELADEWNLVEIDEGDEGVG